jgi:spore germination protein GerM
VLLIDFNSRFEYNRYGYMGLSIQIQQLLWTIFRYNDEIIRRARETGQPVVHISRVSFLIEGRRKSRIGGEGVPLKLFYSRSDLKREVVRSKS